MIETPVIVEAETKYAVVIPLVVTRDDMQREIGTAVAELMQLLREEGLTPAGPVYSLYRKYPDTQFEFEVGVVLAEAFPREVGRIKPTTLEGGRVLRTIHTGPYDRLDEGWGELEAWTKANGYEMEERFWECYLRGPETAQPSSEWETELNWVIRG